MLIYKYRNYVSSDPEILQEKINELIATETMSLAQVEVLGAEAWEDAEEFNCSCKGIFDMLKQGFIFIESAREL